jgi:murein tripeptide amidase MpaA
MSSFNNAIQINSCFDSGNGDLVKIEGKSIHIKIKDEPFTKFEDKQHKQWFHFRASGVKDIQYQFSIINAGQCSFTSAWKGYNVCTSYDRVTWFRTSTSYNEEDGHLSWLIKPTCDVVYFAYFAPYSLDRHEELIAKCSSTPNVKVSIYISI